MSWLVLLVSAVLEAVWATALGQSEGLTRLVPSLIFLVATILSMAGLSWALRTIPLGTAYAVWTGLGAALTAGYAIATGQEAFSVLKLVFLIGIVGAVVGLKFISGSKPASGSAED